MDTGALSKERLFERLAEGHAARITVVTPNRRLAQELAREADAYQLARGLASWEAPDILPIGSFFERLWDEAFHADAGDRLPQLLTPEEEQHLWEEALAATERGSALIAAAAAAAQCRDAWRLMHAWDIKPARANEDAEAFAEWSRLYARRAGDAVDGARLPALAARLADPAKLKLLVAYAFDIVPPQTQAFFDACTRAGIEVRASGPQKMASQPLRLPFPSAREELDAAASWARARLERGAKRVGVVVPDLQQRRAEIARVFARVMGTAGDAMQPFNISIGAPLADYPLVAAALGLIEVAQREVDFGLASRLVRSPFIGDAEAEMSSRAKLDARLRRELPARLTLPKLIAAMEDRCPLLRARLEAVYAIASQLPSPARGRGAGGEGPHEWARHFSALLAAAGFPGERSVDSTEFQTHAKWNDTLAALGRLARVAPRLNAGQALAKLRRLCAESLFQPESPDAPVQVLGILESAGISFDHLWVMGLSEEAWPLPVRPNPFIPVAQQKAAGVPEASADGSLELDRRITEAWYGAAGEVIVSHPLRAEDRELPVSPLIAQLAAGKLKLPRYPRWRDLQFAARSVEAVPDGAAPALAGRAVRGGAKVLADQSACPFRAFARHRLAVRALEEPGPGLSAMDRGTLLHALMKRLWDELGGSAGLAGNVDAAIAKAAAGAVAELEIEGRFAKLEEARLAKLAREWLEVERSRAPFTVVAAEQERPIAIGALELSGRIDRLDRLEDGSHALIDYKTGKVTRSGWMGERPDDPQLPLYAVAAAEDIGAVAFARLKTGEMKYSGYARDKGFVEAAKNWNGLIAGWKAELEKLADDLAAGDARVDPKRLAQTCRLCDLQPLCRVHEKLALMEGEEVDE
ncbi:MAG: PD-(D/E)XK nuclease family protein [Burkholderiales bacterium]